VLQFLKAKDVKKLLYYNIEKIFTRKKDTGEFCRIIIKGFFN
jgi:hypothetical protein